MKTLFLNVFQDFCIYLSRSLSGVPVSFTRGHPTPDSCHFTQDSISHNPLHRLINCITCLSSNLIISSQLSHIRKTLKVAHTLFVFAGDWMLYSSSVVSKFRCFLAFVFWSLDCFLVYDCFAACPAHCLIIWITLLPCDCYRYLLLLTIPVWPAPMSKSFTWERRAARIALDFQIPAVLQLSAMRKSVYICSDPDVVLSTFLHQRLLS